MDPVVKVTRMDQHYVVRVGDAWELVGGRKDVPLAIRSMLRWVDKLGGTSDMASASRMRGKNVGEYRRLRWGTGKASLK